MKFLHLDPTFTPFDKSIAFEAFTFNGGEPHIKIKEDFENSIRVNSSIDQIPIPDSIMITTRIRSFNDLGFLLIATDALRRMGIEKLSLFLPYFPAARQDRTMIKGEALSVKVYADIINAVNYHQVLIVDPHSAVTSALVNRVCVIDNHLFVQKALATEQDYYLIAPDGGALKKAYTLAQFLGEKQVIACSKNRDVQTGKLSGFKVFAEDLQGKTCVIVDDICDGGGTFIGLAKELKKKNAGDLILVVTHGIFSKGIEVLSTTFSKIYCTDSFCNMTYDGGVQFKLAEGII